MNLDRTNHKWDDARDAQLTALWNEGLPLADIAERMFTTVSAIGDRRHLMGLPRRKDPSRGWTDDRVEEAKRLWISGRSATQIAMELNCGLSRNAVIGKIHRLGLSKSGRAACACPAPSMRKRPFAAPKVPRSHVRPPKPGPQNKPAVIHGDYAPSTEAMRLARAAEGRSANDAVAKGGGVESPNARPWMEDRRLGECNWPIGGRYEIKSCCNPVKARGWCAGHLAIGVASVQPQAMRSRDASRLTRFDRVEKDRAAPSMPERSVWDDARAEAA